MDRIVENNNDELQTGLSWISIASGIYSVSVKYLHLCSGRGTGHHQEEENENHFNYSHKGH